MSGLELIGALVSAGGTILSGAAANSAAKTEANQMEAKAKEETAASQREATEKRREGALVNSAIQARAAASGAGAGADAPTIVKLMTGTTGQAEYNAQTVRYGGESRAEGLRFGAKNRRASGRASLAGSVLGGFSQAAGGFAKYRRPA